MNFVRTHRSLIAWMLYGFVLFNGVACGFGHGQMLSAISSVSADDICGDAGAALPSLDKASHALVMQLAMFDCVFAGKLTVALLFFIGLGWLARTLNVRLRLPHRLIREVPRHVSPGCLPQAP